MVAFTEDVVKGQSPQSHEKDYVWHLQCLCPPSLRAPHPPIRGGGKEEEKKEKMEGREEKKRKRKGNGKKKVKEQEGERERKIKMDK
jgi:hypothetical protein